MNGVEPALSPLASAIVLALFFSSLGALVLWVHRWATRGYVLAYQPRTPVPWGWGAAIPAVAMTLLGVANSIAMRLQPVADAAADFDAAEFFQAQLMNLGLQFLFFLGILAVLITTTQANRDDLGLPCSFYDLLEDIGLGVFVGLASMIPIYGTQITAVLLLGIAPGHPLLDQMQANPDVRVFAAAGLAAVVAAPLLEEVLFRLLMQGGLERWEALQLWPSGNDDPQARLEVEEPTDPDSFEPDANEVVTPTLAAGSELWDESPARQTVSGDRAGIVRGLNIGWAPILATSFVFALAHLGAGPSPIPLFVFAMFVGYVYHRTHRIVPCIVAHMLLNATSIAMLILTIPPS